PRRRFIRLALVGALGVLAVLLFIVFVGARQTPLDRATQRAGQQLLADPAFKSKYGSLSKEEAFQAGVKLGQDGGGRVDDATRLASAHVSWSAAVGGEQRFDEATNVLSAAAAHSSAEVCTAERALFDGAVGLPDRDRATVLLVLYLAGSQ